MRHLKQEEPFITVLGMFDLTQLGGAMAVRIYHMNQSLKQFTPTVLLSGTRPERRKTIIRFIKNGGLKETSGIYVEASTSTATEADLFLLAMARRRGIPVIVFIPDAYQSFPDLYPRKGWRVKLLDAGWRFSISAYQQLANLLLFPSWELARCFNNKPPIDILPPGGLAGRSYMPLSWSPPTVVYVGATSHGDGSDLLLESMALVVKQVPDAQCRFISSNTTFLSNLPWGNAPWLIVEKRNFDEIPEVMAQATAAVIPRRQNRYHDLAVPVKLFDYLSYGKPVITTDCREMSTFVQQNELGIVVQDNPTSMAEGIIKLLTEPTLTESISRRTYQIVQKEHAWENRAGWLWEKFIDLSSHK